MKKEKNDSIESAKMALLNTIANIITLVIGMIMVPIIARVLSTEDLGIAVTFISTRNTLVIIMTLAVYSYVNKAMLEYAEDKQNYLYNLFLFCVGIILFFFCIALPFKNQLMNLLSLDDFLFYWIFASMFSFAVYHLGFYYALFHNKQWLVFVITLSVGPIAQFISVGMALVMPRYKYIGRVLGLDFTYVVVAFCVAFWLLFFVKNKRINPEYIKSTLRFTVPIVPHLLSQMVLTQCDLLMISYFCGEDKSGIYSMGHTIGFLAFTLMSQVMAAWSPWVYRRWENKEYDVVRSNAPKILLLGMYVSMGLLTISPELVRIFLTEDYLPCIYIIPPLVIGMFFQFVYIFLYDLEYYNKKSVYILIASVCAAIINIVLNCIFIQKYGYLAAGYTTVFSYFILVLVSYFLCKKLNIQLIYNAKTFVFVILLVSVYALAMLVLNEHIIVRYLVLLLLTSTLLFMEYQDIKKLLISFVQSKKRKILKNE